jgi:hypothetical protein
MLNNMVKSGRRRIFHWDNPVSFTNPTGMAWRWILICRYIDHGENSDTYGMLIEVWREVWFPDEIYI